MITRTYDTQTPPGRYIGVSVGPDAQNPAADYASGYDYDAQGRLNRVTGLGLPAYGAVYSFVTEAGSGDPVSDLIAGVEFKSDASTVSGEVIRTYGPQRDLIASVRNSWDETVISEYGYKSDILGRRESVVNTGSAFTTYSDDGHDRNSYNDRHELDRSQRFDEIDPDEENPTPVEGRDFDYAYDTIGNRESFSIDQAAATTYTANNLNQYDATANPAESFDHDADGNLTSDGSYVYAWNAENRLVSVTPPQPYDVGDKKIDYRYDYLGRRYYKRVQEWNGSQWVQFTDRKFVYDGWNLLLELGGQSGDVVVRYTWGLDLSGTMQGAGGVGGLLAMDHQNLTQDYVVFHDANGNVGQLVDIATGTIGAHYEYDPYGAKLVADGMHHTFNPFRFSTKYFDGEIEYPGTDADGLYYYGFRYYSPRLGRWLNRDPIGESGGINLNAHVRNSPINRVDPVGLQTTQPSTTQPTATRACNYCGPELTRWFTEEVNLHGSFWRSNQRNVGIALRPLYFKEYAAHIPFKWTKFETVRCPSGDACKNTVMLCGTCIHKSELGNLMYGAMAKLWVRGEVLIVGTGVRFVGTDSTEDIAGVVGGLTLGNPVRNGPITQTELCELLQSKQAKYINRIAQEFESGSDARTLLDGLSGNNLADMGKQFEECEKCPDAAPDPPHSSFAWLKTTKDMGSGDWTRTYPEWPIEWPK